MKCLQALCVIVAFGGDLTHAQQSITYSNGENDSSGIIITSATNPTTLTISSGSAAQSGIISQNGGSYAVTKAGNGTLTLTAGNTYTGGTTVSAGTLAIGSGGSLAYSATSFSGGINLTGVGATFDISNGGNQTISGLIGVTGSVVNLGANTLVDGFGGTLTSFAGVIQGAGGFTSQAGVMEFSGANTYTGPTTISHGSELDIFSGGSIAASSGVNLAGSGAVFNLGPTNTDQTIQDLSGVAGTMVELGPGHNLTVGTARSTLYAGSLVNGSNPPNLTFTKQGTGTLTLTGPNTYIGITTVNGGTLAIGAGGSDSETTINLASNGSSFDISAGGNQGIEGLGGVAGSTVNLGANTLTVSQLGGQPGGVSTFAGTIQGNGGLIKTNTGSLVLMGTNTYTGATTVSNGTLQFDQEVSLYHGQMANWTATNLAVASGGLLAFNVGGSGEFTTSDLTTVLQNLGTGMGGFASGAAIGFDTTNATGGGFTYGGIISNTHSGSNVLGLAKLGSETLTLTSADTYSGPTTIQGGTLAIGAGGSIANSSEVVLYNNGMIFDISGGGNQTIQDLVSGASGSLVNLGVNTLTVGSSRSTIFAGIVQGIGALIKQNAGTLTLAGSSTFSGGTILSGGELGLASAGAIGTTGTISFNGGTLQFSSSNTIDYSSRFSTATNQLYSFDTNGASVGIAGNLTSSGGSLTKSGLGTLTLTGANTYTGGTTITGGSLQVGNGGTAGTLGTGGVLNNGALVYDHSIPVTEGNNITGVGSVRQSGPGIVTFTGNNSYTGGTTVSSSALNIQSNAALGSSGYLSISNGAALQIQNNIVTTTAVALILNGTGISGNGALENVSGNNTYTGLITLGSNATIGVDAGTINLTNTGNITGAGYSLTLAGAGNGTLASSINPGAGPLIKNGAGTWVITGSAFYGLNTVINAGTLQVGVGNTNSDLGYLGTITNNGSLVFDFDDPVSGFDDNVISGSGNLIKEGTGVITIAMDNTFTGGTTIKAGMLQTTKGDGLGTGGIAIEANAVLGLDCQNASSPLTMTNVISGAGAVDEVGSYTSIIAAPNTYTGGTIVGTPTQGQGTLMISGSGTLGATTNNLTLYAGTLDLGGTSQTVAAVNANNQISDQIIDINNGTLTANSYLFNLAPFGYSNFAGIGANLVGSEDTLTLSGAGWLELYGNDSFSGGINLNGGELCPYSSGALGSTGTILFNGGSLQFTVYSTADYSSRFSTVPGQHYSIDTYEFSGVWASNLTSVGGSLTVFGRGTLTLTGNNTYSGGTAINGGELNLGSSGALPTTGQISFGGGSLQYSASNKTDYSNLFSNAANQIYSIDTNGQAVTLAGNLASPGGSFTKIGLGTLTLSGINTYTGPTTVTGGILVITGNVTGSSSVLISSGATMNITTGNFATPGTVTNNGTLVLGSGVTFNTTGTFTNNGTLDLRNDASYHLPSNFVNNGVVLFPNSGPQTFAQWEVAFPALTDTTPSDTPMNDGVPNLLKYLYDIDPTRPMTNNDRAALPVFDVTDARDLTIIFREYSFESGIAIGVQTSTNLQNWTTASEASTPTPGSYTLQPTGLVDSNTGDPYMEVDFKPATISSSLFIRLNVTLP